MRHLLLRKLLLVPALAAGLLGSTLVNAAPASAATTQWVGSHKKTVVKDDHGRRVVLRAAMRITYPKNDYPYYQGYISVRTYKKVHGKWKPASHSISGATITLVCTNGVELGERYWDLGSSGSDGFSKKYSRGSKTSTMTRKHCTAVRARFSGIVRTGGGSIAPFYFSYYG